jgi:hypothetical protein
MAERDRATEPIINQVAELKAAELKVAESCRGPIKATVFI